MIWDDQGVQGEGLHCGTMGSWDSVLQIWDGWCCERTLDKLPTDGLRNTRIYMLYICIVLRQYSVLNLVKQ